MARLTLSEQVTALQAEVAELSAAATADKLIIADYTKTIQNQQSEIFRLKQDQDRTAALQEQLAKVTKELESSKSSYSYISSEKGRLEGELEQAHAVLDGVDGAPTREYDMEYGKGKRNVVTRLAGAFLAVAKNGGAK